VLKESKLIQNKYPWLDYFPKFVAMRETPLSVNILNHSGNPLPAYATDGASGMDLRAFLQAPIELKPMERVLVPTGIHIELPENFEAQVRPRSGLAIKQGITCLNTPGTIDADYRGEIKVILINLSAEIQTIENGDRIAQMVIQKVEKINWLPVEEINQTDRGAGGFGHTGKQ
jgi:dUTP pyrophosphatase